MAHFFKSGRRDSWPTLSVASKVESASSRVVQELQRHTTMVNGETGFLQKVRVDGSGDEGFAAVFANYGGDVLEDEDRFPSLKDEGGVTFFEELMAAN